MHGVYSADDARYLQQVISFASRKGQGGQDLSIKQVLVVLVNFHLIADIRRLLSGTALEGCDVVVVDNAAEPEEVQAICDRYHAIPVLLGSNVGFAGAVNQVAPRFSQYQHVLLLNPDVELSAGQLGDLRAHLVREGLTGVSPLLLGVDHVIQVGNAGGPVTNGAMAAYSLFVSHLISRVRGTFFTRQQLRRGLRPDWLCMACLLLDGQAVDQFGLLPEDEIVYCEDVVWGCRATKQGANFEVASDVEVVHRQGAAGGASAWRGATVRMLRKEVGRYRSIPGVAAFWLGLQVRRLLGRSALAASRRISGATGRSDRRNDGAV